MPCRRRGEKVIVLTLQTLFYEDLSPGQSESLTKIVSASDVVGFAEVSGDRNPIHLSEHFAARTPFRTRIAHGLYTASLISALLGTRLPGPGAIYLSQTLNFRAPVRIGDEVVVSVTVAELIERGPSRPSRLSLQGRGHGGPGGRGHGQGSEPRGNGGDRRARTGRRPARALTVQAIGRPRA